MQHSRTWPSSRVASLEVKPETRISGEVSYWKVFQENPAVGVRKRRGIQVMGHHQHLCPCSLLLTTLWSPRSLPTPGVPSCHAYSSRKSDFLCYLLSQAFPGPQNLMALSLLQTLVTCSTLGSALTRVTKWLFVSAQVTVSRYPSVKGLQSDHSNPFQGKKFSDAVT